MSIRMKRKPDPLLVEIERELRPGHFVRYRGMFDFVRHLEQVEEKVAALAKGGEAERAVGLYELFLAGCYEKMEECDDSGGNFSMFWDGLFLGWIQARQAAGLPAADTVRQILKWIENDDYGFCYDIEKEVAKVLTREAYDAFVAHFRKALDEGLRGLQDPRPTAIFEYENSIRLPAMSLKEIYRARGDAESYAALAERKMPLRKYGPNSSDTRPRSHTRNCCVMCPAGKSRFGTGERWTLSPVAAETWANSWTFASRQRNGRR